MLEELYNNVKRLWFQGFISTIVTTKRYKALFCKRKFVLGKNALSMDHTRSGKGILSVGQRASIADADDALDGDLPVFFRIEGNDLVTQDTINIDFALF